ncbi:hypothetical protein T439DRAFT_323197 [Meredithblackwellia eburnea MCA 4105]
MYQVGGEASTSTVSPGSSNGGQLTTGKVKKTRATRACDVCSKRAVKCDGATRDGPCSSCLRHSEKCTYLRPVRKRGKPIGTKDAPKKRRETTWTAPPIASSSAIPTLLEYAHETFYSLFPIFHWPTLLNSLASKQHLQDQGFCAIIFGICALSASRLENRKKEDTSSEERAPFTAEQYYTAARTTVLHQPPEDEEFDHARACLLLAIFSIQHSGSRMLKLWLGSYLSICGAMGLQDESHWPLLLLPHEREERRRVVWCAFQLEVYSSFAFGSPVRHRATQIQVAYPTEVDDDHIGLDAPDSSVPTGENCWLHGWNRATDLYRIIEHALDDLRASHRSTPQDAISLALGKTPKPEIITGLLVSLQASLPDAFKAFTVYDDPTNHRYHIQAINFLMTTQNARLLAICSSQHSGREGIDVAKELLAALRLVPTKYLETMNLTMYNQLAGIGMLLCSSASRRRDDIIELRRLIGELAELLTVLEDFLGVAVSSNLKLKAHLEHLDQVLGPSLAGSPKPDVDQSENFLTDELLQNLDSMLLPFEIFQPGAFSSEFQTDDILFPDLFHDEFTWPQN